MRARSVGVPMRVSPWLAAALVLSGAPALAANTPPGPGGATVTTDGPGALVPRVAARLDDAGDRAEPPDLSDLGADVDLALMDLASDESRPLPLRVRALRALARTPTAAGRDYLLRTVSTLPAEPPAAPVEANNPEASQAAEARQAAYRSRAALARAAALTLGWLHVEDAVDAIERLLAHPDREVRLDAIAALGLLARRAALDALEFRLPREKDAVLKDKLRRQIARLRAQMGPGPTAPAPRLHRAPLRPDGPVGGEREPLRP